MIRKIKNFLLAPYLMVLWALCGGAFYTMLRNASPTLRPFLDSWPGTILIAIAAALFVEPAGRALGAYWGTFPDPDQDAFEQRLRDIREGKPH